MRLTHGNTRLLRPKPYDGQSVDIVIGIDVGTTFSGVSYAIRRPGEVPEVASVSGFSEGNEFKVPSVVYYDRNLSVRAVGAEITNSKVQRDAKKEGWFRSQHFKLHLRPAGTPLQTNGLDIGELPHGKTAEEVMGDFLKYLYNEVKKYIKNRQHGGEKILNEAEGKTIFVLAHPNGWKGFSQERYRRSAILGGLIRDTQEDRRRVRFVTEGEASALACLSGGLGPPSLEAGFKFVIADAGGGTVDVTTYQVTRSSPIELQECAPAKGHFAGSIFVNMSARSFLENKLKGTDYSDEDTMDDIVDDFEINAKREYEGASEVSVRVGSRREFDDTLGIEAGFLTISSANVQSFFHHSVTKLTDAVNQQLSASKSDRKTTPIWLVGGFAASPYLQKALRQALNTGYQATAIVESPDVNLSKAVSNGAVLYFLDDPVTGRVCDVSYGSLAVIPFLPFLPSHRERMDLVRPMRDGLSIGPIFDCIAKEGALMNIQQTSSHSYFRHFTSKEDAKTFTKEINYYQGDGPIPEWYDGNEDKFPVLCTIEADLSELCNKTTLVKTPLNTFPFCLNREPYWEVLFDIEINFGTTELEACVKWKVGNKEKRGPVKVSHRQGL